MKEKIDSNNQVPSPADLDGMMKDEGEVGNLANQLNFISQADAKDEEKVEEEEKKSEVREEDQVDSFGEKLNLISRPGTGEKSSMEKITSDLQENFSNVREELNSITKTDDESDNKQNDKETEFENNETSIVENLNFIAQPDSKETNDDDADDSDLSIDSSSKEEEQVLASTLAFISQQKKEAKEAVAKIDVDDVEVDTADELKFISQADGEETNDNDTEDADSNVDSSRKEEEQVLASTLAFISQQKQEVKEAVIKIDAEDTKVDTADELKFIFQADGEETHDNDSEDADLSIDGEEEVALASRLAFISQSEESLQNQKGKEDVAKKVVAAIDVPEKEEKPALASALAFISQSKQLPRQEKEESTKIDAAGVLKFISQPDSERSDIVEEEGVNSKLDEPSLIDDILSKSSSEKQKQGPTVKTDDSQTEIQRMPTATDTNILENSSSRRATNATHQSPIKHIIALIAFSVIAILMTFAYLRIGLRVFCPYDEKLNTYVVMEKVEQCPVPIQSDDDDESCPFWKKCPDSIEGLIEYVPAPVGKRHEILCRGTFNVLHTAAVLLHPSLSYKKTMPQVHLYSPCPEIPVPAKKKKKNIFQRFFLEKQRTDSKRNAADSSESGDDFDWALYVSAPFDLDLPPKHIELAKKVTENLKRSLATKYPEHVNEKDWFDQKMENVQFGGIFPWWHPVKDKWGKEKESSGLRLVAAYLKIMDWPENLQTKFPFSGVCSNGCPADFAITNTLEFREKYQPWKISPSVYHENRKGWVFVRGYSPTRYHSDPAVGGASVLWMRPGLHKMEVAEPFSRAIMNALDACIASALARSGGKMGKCNIILDCEDVGLSKIPPIGPTKKILKKLQDNYPDKLGTFAITNLSGSAQMFLKVLLPLLPSVVRQKIHIIPNEKAERARMLKEIVHEDFIPVWLGGVDKYKFDAKEYYKDSEYKSEFMTDEESVEFYDTMPYYGL